MVLGHVMEKVFHRAPDISPEIGVQPCTPGVKSGPSRKPLKFKAVAPKLWKKPLAAIADIEKCSPSTAKRILRGDAELTGRLLLAAALEMLKPLD